MAKRSVSLSEINFAMARYLLFIDLMFAKVKFRHLCQKGVKKTKVDCGLKNCKEGDGEGV